jgi:S1-C subfamily serine protease
MFSQGSNGIPRSTKPTAAGAARSSPMHGFLTNIKRSLLIVTAALTLTFAATARATPLDEGLYQRTIPAMCWVISPIAGSASSWGTGALVNVRGKIYVLTAWHVVEDRPLLAVFFPVKDQTGCYILDRKYYLKNRLGIRSTVIYRDRMRDVALIELDRVPGGIKPLELASVSPRQGDRVHIVGNSGIYTGLLWQYRGAKVVKVGYLEINYGRGFVVRAQVIGLEGAYVRPGDSGGPVLNDAGQVVGVISGGTHDGLDNHAIKVNEVQGLVKTGQGSLGRT